MFSSAKPAIFIPPVLKEIAKIFDCNKAQIFLVGGAVRDIFLKKKCSDFDLATNAEPERVIKMFKHVIPTGIKHGTVTVLFKGESFEVTTFRSESDYSDGRHPDKVEYAATIEDDLGRRDFCMNAIAINILNGEVIDPFDGKTDIKNGIIRCVGNAGERFSEDGLRVLRALRFASTLRAGEKNFTLDADLLNAIPCALHITQKVSPERIRDELEKIIASRDPCIAINLMKETGLLKLVLPELYKCIGVEQKGYHRYDVYTHSLLALDYAAKSNYNQTVRLAALFHDLGKPKSAVMNEDGVWTFYNHEKYSCEITECIMTRLRFSNAVRDEVVHLIREHMFHYEDCWNDAAVRRFIMRAGEEYLHPIFQLRMADSFGTQGVLPPRTLLLPFQKRIYAVLEKACAFSLKDLHINGHDIIALGESEGKKIDGRQIGIILNRLLESVLEDPELNENKKLLELAKALL
ncbi:HDIG domain-containing protein [Spirochaetia bacterium]|nr:HDIG domain-containing protein [Spirochaetia bacterium]